MSLDLGWQSVVREKYNKNLNKLERAQFSVKYGASDNFDTSLIANPKKPERLLRILALNNNIQKGQNNSINKKNNFDEIKSLQTSPQFNHTKAVDDSETTNANTNQTINPANQAIIGNNHTQKRKNAQNSKKQNSLSESYSSDLLQDDDIDDDDLDDENDESNPLVDQSYRVSEQTVTVQPPKK